jgi:hypothetical protein
MAPKLGGGYHPQVGSGEAALKYLAPYIFRVAISNRNILAIKDGQVTLRYRDSKTNTTRTTTLPAELFIGRFLQHVLPRGFQKVRTYGLLHPKQRRLLAIVIQQLEPDETVETSHASPCEDHLQCRPSVPLCPQCDCEMIHVRQILRWRGPP